MYLQKIFFQIYNSWWVSRRTTNWILLLMWWRKKNTLRLLRTHALLFFSKCVYKAEKKLFLPIDRKTGRWGRRVVCGYKLLTEDRSLNRQTFDWLVQRSFIEDKNPFKVWANLYSLHVPVQLIFRFHLTLSLLQRWFMLLWI